MTATAETKAVKSTEKNGKDMIGNPSLVKKITSSKEFEVACCALSIYVCYLYYGFLHEKM